MQTFDPQHGLVELGTPGVHSGAVVVDLDAEIAALDRIMASPIYDIEEAQTRCASVWLYGITAREARSGRLYQTRAETEGKPRVALGAPHANH